MYNNTLNTIHMYSGITSGRVLDGKLLCTKILEVNLFAFAYRLFHEDFSSINRALLQWSVDKLKYREIYRFLISKIKKQPTSVKKWAEVYDISEHE